MRRWLRLRSRIRYWHRRALKAESQLADKAMLLEAERVRNQIREDTFVSASIMGQRGMYGVPPRVGPAIQSPKRIEKPVNQYPAWDANLTWADKQEFELEWKTAAERAGVGMAKAQQDFLMEIAKRRVPLQDDPFSN